VAEKTEKKPFGQLSKMRFLPATNITSHHKWTQSTKRRTKEANSGWGVTVAMALGATQDLKPPRNPKKQLILLAFRNEIPPSYKHHFSAPMDSPNTKWGQLGKFRVGDDCGNTTRANQDLK